MPTVSIIMPTYNQAAFLPRALASVGAQKWRDWELLIVDDGATDATGELVRAALGDARIHYQRLAENGGMSAAINHGLERATGDFIAYLPSDDVWYAEHLASLLALLAQHPGMVAAYSGVRHHYNRNAPGQIADYPLQPVQVVHRRTAARWTERGELVSDDHDRLFWAKLRAAGDFIGSGQVTCEWVDHPAQGHKVIREPEGGINPYRVRYGVRHPLCFHSTVGNAIDEVGRYAAMRDRPPTPPAPDGLKIVLVGELAYNADRVLALEERGHTLYGLWMPDPYWYNTVGPLPFGHVTDLPRDGWRAELARLQPDLIYGLLNWQAVPFAHEVLQHKGDIPFVWHFKEGPFICLEKGTWPQLMDLYSRAEGRIYSSPEMRDWFATVLPALRDDPRSFVLDGDLPKRDWFTGERAPLLSATTGEIHTVVPGRPIGLHPETVAELAHEGIHLHFYGDFTHGQWLGWIAKTQRLAEGHLHLHPNVDQEQWVPEFSRYDAGWLHLFRSENSGDLRRANWDDLNYPARIATLALAGLPMITGANPDALVASQTLLRDRDMGIFCTDMADLACQLRDTARMQHLRANVWAQRDAFTFDAHADDLIAFFRYVIGQAQ